MLPGSEQQYDPYTEDISVVHLYWDTQAVMQFQRARRLTWVDYLSQVGGLLGLFLGFSLVSGVELLYWLTCRLPRNWAHSE